MADPTAANASKESYMSYDVYLRLRRSVHFYNLGLKDQAAGGFVNAAVNYFMALGLNPNDVDSKAALEYMRSNPSLGPAPPGGPTMLGEADCTAAKQEANRQLKKCGFCPR